MLADMGATVIKIEDPSGDGVRHYPPLYSDGNSIKFHALNRGKQSLVFNLKQEQERKRFLELLPTVDVVLESFRPGVLEKLLNVKNIEELYNINPKRKLMNSETNNIVIIARISAFGQNAPDHLKNVPAQYVLLQIF
jgi:CoA:oxalate CoA-transferase